MAVSTNNRVPKPSITDIQAIEKKAFSDHDKRIANYKRWMSYYNRTFRPFNQPPDPSRYKVVIPGTAHALIDKAAAQLTTDNPIVTINPFSRISTPWPVRTVPSILAVIAVSGICVRMDTIADSTRFKS